MQVDERKFVRREGPSLVLDGRPFFFAGFNNYYMMTRSADSGTRKEVRQWSRAFSLWRRQIAAFGGLGQPRLSEGACMHCESQTYSAFAYATTGSGARFGQP